MACAVRSRSLAVVRAGKQWGDTHTRRCVLPDTVGYLSHQPQRDDHQCRRCLIIRCVRPADRHFLRPQNIASGWGADCRRLAGSVIVGDILGVWNPGFILIFATAATVFGYSFLADGRALTLALATAALAIGMQVHLQITQVALGLILATESIAVG